MSGWEEAEPRVFWLDSPLAPERLAPLEGTAEADLAIVGGGFTGLWAALLAKQRDPGREVVLLEAGRVGAAASGRNGGFVDASLTHGVGNGLSRFPDELERLLTLGRENFAAIEGTLTDHGIDAGWERPGQLTVATRPHELPWVEEEARTLRAAGEDAQLLDGERLRAELDSPTYLGGALQRSGCALVDPARLGWGLLDVVLAAGVRVHEDTRVTGLRREGRGVRLSTGAGHLDAAAVVLATNAFPPLVRAIRRYVVPVYDYVLVTEPLSPAQRGALGWRGRQGVSDAGNQFHYYRLTADDRILWGGYDAIYGYGNAVGPELEQRPASFALLERHFHETFPQLEGIRFSHRWGGAIDTCSRFCATFGTALGGRAAYAVGYTGLGVAASRFGARVALELVGGRGSELTTLRMVRRRPIPFPPEPLRWLSIGLTQRALARADSRGGRRGPWLRALDSIGAGFDS
ncbi:MAG TPA: FAD-dependent oxidoreductase [Thermoleophilaceae bacterium]